MKKNNPLSALSQFVENKYSYKVKLNIDKQNEFSEAVYKYLGGETISKNGVPLSKENFVRIWKHCIFRRCYELNKKILGEEIPLQLQKVPVPLALLLGTLGRLEYKGFPVDIELPKVTTETWATLNYTDETGRNLLNNWEKFMTEVDKTVIEKDDNIRALQKFPSYEQTSSVNSKDGITLRTLKKIDLLHYACHDTLFEWPNSPSNSDDMRGKWANLPLDINSRAQEYVSEFYTGTPES